MRYFSLFLLSVFLIPIIQTANAQTIPGQNGEANGKLPVVASKYMNNTSVGQAGLIQNNPGYAKYIPGSGFLNNTPNNTGHENLKNITKIKEATVRINSIENHADDIFDMAIAKLFEEEKML